LSIDGTTLFYRHFLGVVVGGKLRNKNIPLDQRLWDVCFRINQTVQKDGLTNALMLIGVVQNIRDIQLENNIPLTPWEKFNVVVIDGASTNMGRLNGCISNYEKLLSEKSGKYIKIVYKHCVDHMASLVSEKWIAKVESWVIQHNIKYLINNSKCKLVGELQSLYTLLRERDKQKWRTFFKLEFGINSTPKLQKATKNRYVKVLRMMSLYARYHAQFISFYEKYTPRPTHWYPASIEVLKNEKTQDILLVGNFLYLILKSWMKMAAEPEFQSISAYGETICEVMNILNECKNRNDLWKSLYCDINQMNAPYYNSKTTKDYYQQQQITVDRIRSRQQLLLLMIESFCEVVNKSDKKFIEHVQPKSEEENFVKLTSRTIERSFAI